MKNIALLLFALVMVSPSVCFSQASSDHFALWKCYREEYGVELAKDILAQNDDHEFRLLLYGQLMAPGERFPWPKVGSIGIPTFLGKVKPDVIQITQDGAILDFGDFGDWVYLTGFDTSNLVDGGKFVFDKPVKYAGTKSYTSVAGANKTLKHFSRYSYPKEFLEKQKELRDPNFKKPKVSRIAYYNLKNGSSVKGRFVSYGGGKLVLQNLDGKTISIATKELESKSKSYASKQRSAFKAKD
ncbi:hypothetical protein OAU26_08205 [Mariniblastus sp.]|nr:hypothetical protein [Mariniblastus sp.]